MVRKILFTALLMVSVVPVWTQAHAGMGEVVDVRIVSDPGRELAQYRAYPRGSQPRGSQDGKYYYVEAVKGDRYSIRVTNKSDSRVGVVIAVDGRNIISGKKSDLKRNERMYIIGPRETNTFEGWRTAMDRTNRFYFTEQSDSYAEKVFADASAMGTIALAVYRERCPEIAPRSDTPHRMKEAPAGTAPPAPNESRASGSFRDLSRATLAADAVTMSEYGSPNCRRLLVPSPATVGGPRSSPSAVISHWSPRSSVRVQA